VIIYAIRGTEGDKIIDSSLEFWHDLANDINLGLMGNSVQSNYVINEWRRLTKDNGKKADYYVTGHSLGGRLAQDVVRKTFDENEKFWNIFHQIPTPKHVATFNALGYNFVQIISLLPINLLEVFNKTVTNFYYEGDTIGAFLGKSVFFGRIGKDVEISRHIGDSLPWHHYNLKYHGFDDIFGTFDSIYPDYSIWID